MPKLLNQTILCAIFCLATSAIAQTSSNTMVRFHFYHGTTTVGDVEVELFDQDKPVTVSNFLRYVRSGAYHNLLLNRCVPGFVIQGGGAWTPAPLSSYLPSYFPVPEFGPITNEFGVGPQLSNTFGTISMARVPGDTNSASSQWFFNLNDNSTPLDTTDGGFTVFGRAVSGTNALDFFNHPSPELNFSLPTLGNLPFTNPAHICSRSDYSDCPRENELYHVKISVLPITDTNPPTITVTSPAASTTVSNSSVTFTGTAADDQGVDSIFYTIFNWLLDPLITNAPGGSQWTFTTDLPAGSNYIYVSSVDTSGQRSASVARSVFSSVREPLHLTTNGRGTILGATNGQLFEIGRPVTLTARPAPGYLFAGWSGFFTYSPSRVSFLMRSNVMLTATFVTNPFPPLKATYSGLFFNPDVSFQPSGAITFNVTDQGKVSGKLNVLGRRLPFSGSLSPYGEANIRISAASVAPVFGVPNDWYVRFILDVTNKSDRVFGPSDGTPYPYVWNPTATYGFTSALSVNRARPGTTANPSPYAGKYTLTISGSTNVTVQPGGDSYGAVTVSASGTAKFIGTLADGTPFTQSAPVSTNGLWPFYSGLYGARGWMFGWVGFDFNRPADDLHGQMHWRKAGPQPGRPFGNGFEFFPTLAGSRYTTATSTNRILTFSDGVVALSGPNLAAPSTNHVFLNTNNTVLNLDTNKLTFAILKPSGLFSGTVRPVGETRTIPFKGALLKKQDYGTGFYLSTNQSGRVYFGP